MSQRVFRAMCLALALLLPHAFASAQSPTSSLAGVVTDTSGATIPGASVTVKSNAGATYEAVTSDRGTFNVPALDAGKYTVTITLQGFKTVVLTDVEVNAGVPASVRATLEVGGLAETVTVQGGAEIIQTQSATVSTTLNTNQISNLPLTSRNVVDFVTFLPGVQTAGGNRDSIVNGLPQSVINMTVDGLNVQDNHLKTGDGFFARMSPRLDSVEQVTVTTAANGADASGQGAVQVRFVTRSGSNDFRGSAYHYYRNDALNATNWFSNRDGLAKPNLLQNQPGVRLGGPIVIPGLWNGRDRAFFFVNYEELRQPQDVSRNRTVLQPSAQAGVFRYNAGGGVRDVNLLALAAARGHLATVDPTIAKVLADIRGAVTGAGTLIDLTDPNLQRFSYQVPQRSHNIYPTGRLDFNLNDAHRLSANVNYNHILSDPDTLNGRDAQFPGFPVAGVQDSDRYTTGASLRSTFGSNWVNELRIGGTGGATLFSPGLNAGMWGGTPLADQAGFHLNMNGGNTGLGITNASSGPTPSSREASTKVLENTLNYLKGAHSMSFGVNYTRVDLWLKNQQLVPQVNFGIVSGDPADTMFTTANFPGASSTNLNAARNLYSVLVGRISSITGLARLNEANNQYEYLGLGIQRGRMADLGIFAQDSWRLTPNFTLNLGLRYELQYPFHPLNDSYLTATVADVCGVSGVNPGGDGASACNLFQPGNTPGQVPTFQRFAKGTKAFNLDKNNFAPSVGFAWTPGAGSGWRTLVGSEGDTVIRGGYALAYNRNGMSDFSNVFGANPGISLSADRSQPLGNLGALPLLFRERARLGPGAFPSTLTLPFTEVVTGDVNIFDPNLQVPYADSWQFGVQRAISRNMVVEARYVGTRSRDGWTAYNYNELNIVENGFLSEFRKAQANLAANIAAGRGNTFAYTGIAGTSPLPIFLAYFRGAGDANNPALYTSSLFSNSTFVNPLAVFNPQPFTAANALDADSARRANALAAGLPANFLVANPHLLGGANLTGNGGKTRYDSLQLELRRRLSNGLQFDTSYVLGNAFESSRYTFRQPRVMTRNVGAEGDVTHALKATVVYDLPFGRGRRFGGSAGTVLDRVIGGWQVAGTARIQSGRLVDFGNVRLVGMTEDDVRAMFKLRFDGAGRVWMLPQAVIDETVKAFSVSATSPTGYGSLGAPSGRYFAPANGPDCIEPDAGAGFGDCGTNSLVVQGPMFQNYDLSIVKRIPIVGRLVAEMRVEALNVFNNVNFAPVGGLGNNPDSYEVTSLTGTNLARVVQLVSRISW